MTTAGMVAESDSGRAAQRRVSGRHGAVRRERRWDDRADWVLLIVLVTAVFAAYWTTFVGIVDTWIRSEAFRHGILIFPIAAYLIWQRRDRLVCVPRAYSRLGLALVAVSSFAWWVGDLLAVQALMQLGAVAMFPTLVLALIGRQAASVIAFPLGFMMFAVPFGEFLIPYLINFTAAFTVDTLNVLGIPVFRDGRYFHIPTGSYEVARACSGLNYFIVTLVLATLLAHLLFSTVRKALLFVGFALLLAVVANAIRAIAIVLLLHTTELDIAAGEDHAFVGWIIYALMMAALVAAGDRFRDPPSADDTATEQNFGGAPTPDARFVRRPLTLGSLAFVLVLTGPALATVTRQDVPSAAIIASGLPAQAGRWREVANADDTWRPGYQGYSRQSLARYTETGAGSVDVAVVRYFQQESTEITDSANSVVASDGWTWRNVNRWQIAAGSEPELEVQERVVSNGVQERLVWQWLQVGTTPVDNVLEAKYYEIRGLIAGRPVVSSAVMLSTPVLLTVEQSRALLERFAAEYFDGLQRCLTINNSDPACTVGASLEGETSVRD